MKKLFIITALLLICGCNEANKPEPQSIWKPVPANWAAQYGDSEDSRLSYNLIMLARANAELGRRIAELESKAIMDGDMVWRETTGGYYRRLTLSTPSRIHKVDPNDPNK